MKKIAILIPVFNNIEFTRKCLRTLGELISNDQFEYSEFKIIVIDDGSTDGTGEWLSVEYPDIVLLKGDGHLWWSGGINMGARYAVEEQDADYVLLWNNDIIPADDYFTSMDHLIKEMDKNTIAGSKIFYDGHEDLIWAYGGIFNPKTGYKTMLAYNQSDSEEFSRAVSVDWLPGMGTLIPVNVIHEIGYWDDVVFPQYHGDSDFTYRAKTASFNIMVYPQLKLWNDKTSSGLTHGGSFKGLLKSFSSVRSNSDIRKNIQFYQRHATSVLAYRVLVYYYFMVIGGFVKWKFLSLFGMKKSS